MDNAKQYFDFLESLPERFDVDRIVKIGYLAESDNNEHYYLDGKTIYINTGIFRHDVQALWFEHTIRMMGSDTGLQAEDMPIFIILHELAHSILGQCEHEADLFALKHISIIKKEFEDYAKSNVEGERETD